MRPLEFGQGRPPLKDLVSAFPGLSVRRHVGGDVNIHQKLPGEIERILEVHPVYETKDQRVPFVAIRVSDVPRDVRQRVWKEPDATYTLKPVGMSELDIAVGEGSNPDISFQEVLEAARRGFDILTTFFRTDRDERDRYTGTVIDELGSRDVGRDLAEADSILGATTRAVLYDNYAFTSSTVATYMSTVLRRNSVM